MSAGVLKKIIKVGDELNFDIGAVQPGARKEISIFLIEKSGRSAVLKIVADRSIPIRQFKQQQVGE
jgi:hypothetical protein